MPFSFFLEMFPRVISFINRNRSHILCFGNISKRHRFGIGVSFKHESRYNIRTNITFIH